MSIATQLQIIIDRKAALKVAKKAIQTAIVAKGVECPDAALLGEYPALIDAIEQGGGVAVKDLEFVDIGFTNLVENSINCSVDLLVRVATNGKTISSYGIQFRKSGTESWINVNAPIMSNNSDVNLQHGFDKEIRGTITGMLYKHSYNEESGRLIENNNTYEARAYVIYDSNTLYSAPATHVTGWGRYFDNIYDNANNLELNNTKQKRAIIVTPSYRNPLTLSQLGGEYYKTSDGYLGVSENHSFNESLDIPIYLEDGITISYYVRWVILYTNQSNVYIYAQDRYNKNYMYAYFGSGTIGYIDMGTVYTGDPVSLVESLRFHPSSQISVSQYGLTQCKNLKTIILPNTITALSDHMFYQSGILSFIIPSSITTIAAYSLSQTTLTSIIIPSTVSSLGDSWASGTNIGTLVLPSSITILPSNCFYNMQYLYNLVLPLNITSMGVSCFSNCKMLEFLVLPTLITSLPASCFGVCTILNNIIIPSSVTSLGTGCFSNCASLKYIKLPASVTTIPTNCFYQCSSLITVNLDNITSLGVSAFQYCFNLNNVIIPSAINTIPDSCFDSCYNLKSAFIPSSITSIGVSAFRQCSCLCGIIIPPSVTSLKATCFSSCISLKYVALPSSITSMGVQCFYGCTSLKSINIPSSVTSLDAAFAGGCNILTSITFGAILNISGQLFNSTTLSDIRIPSGWNYSVNFKTTSSGFENLSHKCMLDIFNNLASGVTGLTLTLGATNLARMTTDEKLIATNKGWTLN